MGVHGTPGAVTPGYLRLEIQGVVSLFSEPSIMSPLRAVTVPACPPPCGLSSPVQWPILESRGNFLGDLDPTEALKQGKP